MQLSFTCYASLSPSPPSLSAVGGFNNDCSMLEAWWQLSTLLCFLQPLAIFPCLSYYVYRRQ